jgi:hypothetical protein
MNDSHGRRSSFGMTGGQIAVLAVLALLTFGVVIGGGYYVFKDSGLIGGTENEPVAQSPATQTNTPDGESPPTATSTSESGGKLPPAWTPTPFGLAEINYVQWTIQLSDLPMGFKKIPFEEFEAESGFMGDEDEGEIVNAFSFSKEDDNFQVVYGFTGLVLEHERQGFDDAISMSDVELDEMVNSFDHNGILERGTIDNLEGLGDIAMGYSYLLDMEGIDFRLEFILFRRDIAGAMIFTAYVDDMPTPVSIRDLAYVLDQRIIPTLPNNP